MKLHISDECIRCGLCEDLYPELYKRNYEKHCFDILIDEIPEEEQERAVQSAKDCAVGAIQVKK